MQITKHFNFDECCTTQVKNLKEKNKLWATDYLENIKRTANVLECVRDRLDKPMHITSWVRCPELNKYVASVSKNHLYGESVDFQVHGMEIQDVFDMLFESSGYFVAVGVTKVIIEKNSWIHLECKKELFGRISFYTTADGKSYEAVKHA